MRVKDNFHFCVFSGDDASPRHMEEQESYEKVALWNITYPSKKDYEAREYRTTVYIYSSGFWGRDYVGESTVTYKVTRDLNGKMEYKQKIPSTGHLPNMVRSTEGTELSVNVHDPSREYFFSKPYIMRKKVYLIVW